MIPMNFFSKMETESQISKSLENWHEHIYTTGDLPGSPVVKILPSNTGGISSIRTPHSHCGASLVVQIVKNLPAMRKTQVQSLGWEDPGEGNGRLQSTGSPRVRHDCATITSLHSHCGGLGFKPWSGN